MRLLAPSASIGGLGGNRRVFSPPLPFVRVLGEAFVVAALVVVGAAILSFAEGPPRLVLVLTARLPRKRHARQREPAA